MKAKITGIKIPNNKEIVKMQKDDLIFAKVKTEAKIPTKDYGNAGYDIYACFDEDYISIKPHETKLIPTGVAAATHPSKYIQIEERGSTGSKGIKKSAGVVDSSYRGEIFVAITNTNNRWLFITKLSEGEMLEKTLYNTGDILYPYNKAIAQLIVHEVPVMNVQEISYEELKDIPSDRGGGKLGSSGK
jgi:dUTP pyrophosphatase